MVKQDWSQRVERTPSSGPPTALSHPLQPVVVRWTYFFANDNLVNG